jgi:hypothetical protein
MRIGTRRLLRLRAYSLYAAGFGVLMSTRIWLVSSSVADVSIAVALVRALSIASAQTSIRTTKAILSQLIFVAIESGTFTTILALLVLSIYLAMPMTNDSAYFSFCLGRAYTLTLLFNLNLRRKFERVEDTNTIRGFTMPSVGATAGMSGSAGSGAKTPLSESHGRGLHGAGMDSTPNTEVYNLGGIHVHRTANIAVDKKSNNGFNDSDVSVFPFLYQIHHIYADSNSAVW